MEIQDCMLQLLKQAVNRHAQSLKECKNRDCDCRNNCRNYLGFEFVQMELESLV